MPRISVWWSLASVTATLAMAAHLKGGPHELSSDPSSSAADTDVGSAAELDSTYVPRESHSPTPDEKRNQEENYRLHPNRGFIVTDPDRGQLRQPTGKEAEAAISHAVAYHKRNKAVLDALVTGGPVNVTTPENEESLAKWSNASTPNTVSGKERYRLRIKQDLEMQKWTKPSEKVKQKVGYAPPHDSNDKIPSSEYVNMKELTGRDVMTKLPPLTHMPPWVGCVSGPSYEQFFHKDLRDALRAKEVSHSTTHTWLQCEDDCNKALEDCLGYVRHDKGTANVSHDCWFIPGSEFPEGVNSSSLQDWSEGSVWLKDMTTVNVAKNCTNYKAPPNVVPQSDFGTKVDVPKPTAEEVADVNKRAREFYQYEVDSMNAHPDADLVDRDRNQSIAYRLEQEGVFAKERLVKVEEVHEKTIVKDQERAKKKKIADALHTTTIKEREDKDEELKKERKEKGVKEGAEKAEVQKEREQKHTPEGQIVEAELTQKKEEVAKKEEEEQAERTKEYELYISEVHTKELERLASLNKNISVALNATQTGNATYDQLSLLDQEGIPYRDAETQRRGERQLGDSEDRREIEPSDTSEEHIGHTRDFTATTSANPVTTATLLPSELTELTDLTTDVEDR